MFVYVFTSFSYSYLNRARVLARTLKYRHPDWRLWACIVDKEPDGFRFTIDDEDFDGVITADEMFGEEAERWLFGHDVVEACTAIKGAAANYLLRRADCEKLIYLDPDIAVINKLGELSDALDSSSIVLTPHQIDPEPRGARAAIRDNEIASLQYGSFNLGFIGIANDPEGRRFASWWDDRLRDWCFDRLDIGVFVDQKWCNLVPCFFDNVKIVRDPGYNVASWNLSQRTMSYDDEGTALINERPLRFFHFTKLGAVGDIMTQRYAEDNIEVYELWWWYRQQVLGFSSPEIPKGWWHYGSFDNGEVIPKSVRELYRDRSDLRRIFAKPMQTGPDSFYNWVVSNTNLLAIEDQSGGFKPA